MDLTDLAAAVATRSDLAQFVRVLLADCRENAAAEASTPSGPWTSATAGWENPTLDRFLEALAGYADEGQGDQPATWRTFAELLAAAKVYE